VASVDPAISTSARLRVLIRSLAVDGREDRGFRREEAFPTRAGILRSIYTAMGCRFWRVHFRYRLKVRIRRGTTRARPARLLHGSRLAGTTSALSPATVTGTGTSGDWSGLELPRPRRWYQDRGVPDWCHRVDGVLGAAAAAWSQRRRHLHSQETLKGRYEATLAERARIARSFTTRSSRVHRHHDSMRAIQRITACGRRRESSRSTARCLRPIPRSERPEFDLDMRAVELYRMGVFACRRSRRLAFAGDCPAGRPVGMGGSS